jgi:hypothetical protein
MLDSEVSAKTPFPVNQQERHWPFILATLHRSQPAQSPSQVNNDSVFEFDRKRSSSITKTLAFSSRQGPRRRGQGTSW